MDISVYFSPSGIRMAVGSFSKGNFSLKRLISYSTERDSIIGGVITNDKALKYAVLAVWREYKLPKRNVRLVIDGGAVLLRPMTVPTAGKRRVESIIRGQFSDVENAEGLLIDYTVDEPALKNGGASVYAYAAQRDFIGSYVDIFRECGIKIKSINTAQNSCINYMKLTRAAEGKSCILACADGNALLMLLFSNGRYRFSNRVRLFADRETCEYAEEICSAVSQMIQFHKSQKHGSGLTDIFFCGLGSDHNEVIYTAQSSFGNLNISDLPIPVGCMLRMESGMSNNAEVFSDYVYCLGNLIE